MIDPQLYVTAKTDNKVTTTWVTASKEFQATFAETDDLGNAITPVVETATLAQITGLINVLQDDEVSLQAQLTALQTRMTDAQTLLADATAASKAGAQG
jgi:hypothetical protein